MTIKEQIKAEIERRRQLIRPRNTGEMDVVDTPKPLEQGWLNALKWMGDIIDSLQQEQPSEELEAEINAWYNTMGIPVSPDALKETARHFYELGLNAKKEE